MSASIVLELRFLQTRQAEEDHAFIMTKLIY